MLTKTCDIWTPGIFFKLEGFFLDINHSTNFRHIKTTCLNQGWFGGWKKNLNNSPNAGDLQVIYCSNIDQNTHKFEGIPSCRQAFPPNTTPESLRRNAGVSQRRSVQEITHDPWGRPERSQGAGGRMNTTPLKTNLVGGFNPSEKY